MVWDFPLPVCPYLIVSMFSSDGPADSRKDCTIVPIHSLVNERGNPSLVKVWSPRRLLQ